MSVFCKGCKKTKDNEDFGINKNGSQYKTCVMCRARNKNSCKTYSEIHPERGKYYYEAHEEKSKEHNKQYREKNVDRVKEYDKQYREKHADKLKEYARARDQIKVYCPHCNSEIIKRKLNSHLQSQKCKKKHHPNDDYIIVGGRTYLKGKSPSEGFWHRGHTPFEVKHYAIIENHIPRSVAITTM